MDLIYYMERFFGRKITNKFKLEEKEVKNLPNWKLK